MRFTDQVGKDTRIKLMTDGILLNELQRDRDLEALHAIFIDEAHERSLTIDFLLGYLKQLLPRRPGSRSSSRARPSTRRASRGTSTARPS